MKKIIYILGSPCSGKSSSMKQLLSYYSEDDYVFLKHMKIILARNTKISVIGNITRDGRIHSLDGALGSLKKDGLFKRINQCLLLSDNVLIEGVQGSYKWFQHFRNLKVDLKIIYLHTHYDILVKRMKERRKETNKSLTEDTLRVIKELKKSNENLFNKISKEIKCLQVNTNITKEETLKQIINFINE